MKTWALIFFKYNCSLVARRDKDSTGRMFRKDVKPPDMKLGLESFARRYLMFFKVCYVY